MRIAIGTAEPCARRVGGVSVSVADRGGVARRGAGDRLGARAGDGRAGEGAGGLEVVAR